MSLQGKTAVVTGAAGAIGATTSRDLARAGTTLILIDVAGDATAALAAEIGGHAVRLDLSDAEAITAASSGILGQFGRVDILVNNAGVLNNARMAATTLDDSRRVLAINVDPAFLLAQAFLPGMRAARWGRIINMSSYAAKSGGLSAGTAYSVSKTAMLGLTFAIAREVAGDGVTVNAIAPAYVMLPMVSEQLTAEQRATQRAAIPVGRFCKPEEVAHAVTFLALPGLRFVIDHIAKPEIAKGGFAPWAVLMQPFGDQTHVWCELSGMVTKADWAAWTPADIAPYIAEILRIFGPVRCLMGTDWPVSLLAADYRRTVDLVRNAIAHLPEADQRAILWGSAAEVYHLSEGRL